MNTEKSGYIFLFRLSSHERQIGSEHARGQSYADEGVDAPGLLIVDEAEQIAVKHWSAGPSGIAGGLVERLAARDMAGRGMIRDKSRGIRRDYDLAHGPDDGEYENHCRTLNKHI